MVRGKFISEQTEINEAVLGKQCNITDRGMTDIRHRIKLQNTQLKWIWFGIHLSGNRSAS